MLLCECLYEVWESLQTEERHVGAAAASQGATSPGARTAGCPASAVAARGGAAKVRDGKIPKRDEPSPAQGSGISAKSKLSKLTLQKLGPNDDIEHFLPTFERIAKQQEWAETVWATQLAGLLTGKALAAYPAITGDEAQDYDRVKEAVLHRYDVNEETLRHRDSGRVEGKKRPEESYRAWVCRTADDFGRPVQMLVDTGCDRTIHYCLSQDGKSS